VVLRGPVAPEHARAFLAGSGSTDTDQIRALDEAHYHGLIRDKGGRLEATERGEQWILALRAARTEPEAYHRAVRLYAHGDHPPRKNPSSSRQGSFAWAGDPRQLGLFDRPRIEPTPDPEASPEARAAFGEASAAELRTPKPKPKPAPKRKAAPKPKRAWGRIELDAAGNLTPKGIRAWSERAVRGVSAPLESEGPELPYPPDRSWHPIRDAWRLWAERRSSEDEPKRWARFWHDYREIWTDDDGEPKLHNGHVLTHEYALRRRWIELASADSDRDDHSYARMGSWLPVADDPAYERLREAVKARRIASWGGPDEERATERELDAAWLALLNRWIDKPWSYPKQNPEAGTSKTTRERGAAKQRIAGYRAEIRAQRAEQKRARADRRSELERARGQTKRIRSKVTEASAARRARIRQRAWDRIDRARARIEEMRRYWAEERGKGPPPGARRRSLGEQNEEAEREIRAIDPMLVPLWRANRSLFKGTPHERFERFLEWADEQGEADVWAAIEKTLPTDAQLARDYEAWVESQDDPAYLAWKAAQGAA